jgi:hypothetical protein
MPVSPEARQLQLRLIFGFFFVVLSLFCLLNWLRQAQYALFGVTTQAHVVDVEGDYDSRGARLPYHKIDYQYFDDQAKAVRLGSRYVPFTSPTPALGESFAVEYLPNHDDSVYVPDGSDAAGRFGATIPVFVLALVLGSLLAWSVRRGGC